MRWDLTTLLYDLRNITPLLVYQVVASIFVAYSAIIAFGDWFSLRRPSRFRVPDLEEQQQVPRDPELYYPSISVLIPARNEAEMLQRAVGSLIAQEYPGEVEILILDDDSSDHTGFIAGGLAASNSRVRALSGGALQPGWKGKTNALRQLAAEARGELLLFTDADCVFHRGSLEAVVRFRSKVKADCLSLMPYLECRTFWEHVLEPLQYFLLFVTMPIQKVYTSRNPAFAAAHGAFLLIPRTLYQKLGGHETVKGELAEDIKFAQHVKRRGYRLVYGDGTGLYTVRMYKSLREVWSGISKNLFPAMGKRLPILALWTIFLLITQVLPFAFVITALLEQNSSPALLWIPLAQCIVALSIRIALSVRFRQALWSTLLHPFGWIMTIMIALHSAYLTYSGKGHAWKGRVYTS